MKTVCLQNLFTIPWLPALLTLLATGQIAHSTTYTWNNPLGGNWNLAGDWSPDTGVPGSADTAVIGSGSYTVTVNDTEAVGTLTMNGTSGTQTLNITSGGTLSVNSASTGNAHAIVEVSGGTLNGTGNLALAGNLDWTGGTISLGALFNGGSFSTTSLFLDGGMLTNNGVLNWTNNAALYDGNNSVFTNLPGASIIVSNCPTWVFGGYYNAGTHVFGNGGTIVLDGPNLQMETMNYENFINSGTITINTGTLNLNSGSLLDSGPVNVVPAGAMLELDGADTFTAASSISGAGNFLVSGGTVALNSGLALTGAWTFSGGATTITGTDSTDFIITVSGGTVSFDGSGTLAPLVLAVSGGMLAGPQNLQAVNLDWSGGTITNTGIWFDGGSFSTTSLFLDGGMLTNNGVLNWTNNAALYDGNGSVFTNLPGASIIVSNCPTWVFGGYYNTGTHVFGNGGTIVLDGPNLQMETMNYENFINSGTITINTGTLNLNSGSLLDSGPVNVASGATLNLSGVDSSTAASSISGAGNFLVSGGTVALTNGLGLTGSWTFSGGDTTIMGPDTASFFNGTTITNSGGTVSFDGSGTLAPFVLAVSGGTLAGSQSLVAVTFNWSGGTISSGVWFAGGSFSTTSLFLDGGMLTNNGVLNWTNNAALYDGNGSVFTNLPGATIIVSNSPTWVYGGYYPAGIARFRQRRHDHSGRPQPPDGDDVLREPSSIPGRSQSTAGRSI
jgi:hypothetical protein